MDSGINVRFYKVSRAEKSHPMLLDQLDKIYKSGNQKKRTKDANGVKVRLERFDNSSNIVFGEFVRLQETGYPSEVHDDKVTPLSTEAPLGHHVAFAYDKSRHVLAIQYDLKALALSRINQYIAQYSPNIMYLFTPLYRDDAWAAVTKSPPRKISFSVAYPELLSNIVGDHKSLYENIAAMGNAMDTHIVDITLSMGQTKGLLRDPISFCAI